jgi:phosphatidylglycerophosphate synthase
VTRPSASTLALKQRDAVWTVTVIDPLAVPLVRRVVGLRPITPNRLTAASALVAIGAGVLFALGELVAGALAYQLSFLLDCMDGKLAALRAQRNPLGGWLDVLGDTVRLIACSVGLMIAIGGDADAAAPLLLAYVGLRFGVLAIAEARPQQPGGAKAPVRATAAAVLRAAPRRAAPPGTTVDIEALVFTLGPLVGLPVIAAGVAAGLESLHLAMYVLQAIRGVRRLAATGGT